MYGDVQLNIGLVRWQAECIADCFKKASLDNLDSKDFVEKFIFTEFGNDILDDNNFRYYYCWTVMYDKFIHNVACKSGGTVLDEYLMWMYGYVIKYWQGTRNFPVKEIYKILPLDKFDRLFDFYHTQSWDYIIEDSIRRWKCD